MFVPPWRLYSDSARPKIEGLPWNVTLRHWAVPVAICRFQDGMVVSPEHFPGSEPWHCLWCAQSVLALISTPHWAEHQELLHSCSFSYLGAPSCYLEFSVVWLCFKPYNISDPKHSGRSTSASCCAGSRSTISSRVACNALLKDLTPTTWIIV